MRFGETWSAGLVPEWAAQYVDYLSGKKLLHRLEKENSPVGTYGADTSAHPSAGPSPAQKPHATMELDETSPLLYGQRESFTFPRLPESAIPLTELERSTKARVFFKWLDKEINRVNEFYTQQEKLTVEKLDLIKSELATLGRHKTYLKSQAKKTATPRVFLDMPSLPQFFQHDRTQTLKSPSDFNHAPISYSHAKQMLKTALLEYYKSIQHLRGYRSLNETAIRKVNKKFDKTFHVATVDKHYRDISDKQFIKSHKLDALAKEVETLYADTFEHGNHKYAIEKLQSNPEKSPHNFEVLISGLLLGCTLPLFLIALINGVRQFEQNHDWETRALLNVWACWTILALICLLFSLNILVWKMYRVNYVFIFEFDRYNYLDYREYPIMPAALFALLSLCAYLTFNTNSPYFASRYYPCIFIGIAFIAFLIPTRHFFFGSARRWLQLALVRLIFSGAFDVEFRDFFLGDIFCSLNYTLGNVSFFFCLYSTSGWWLSDERSAHCTSSQSRLLGFFNTLPGIWRWLQCIRRFLDTEAYFPHLFNALKYTFLILSNMFLSLARINGTSTKWEVCYITFAALNAVYSSLWDVVMDFSLGLSLREVKAFPAWTYYAVMVVDPILRFNWVLYLVWWNQKQQSDKVSFIVALIEITRRFIWIFFRVENEHSANVTKFRAFKDLNLPYHVEGQAQVEPPPTTPIGMPLSHAATSTSFGSLAQSPYIASVRRKLNLAHTTDFARRAPTEDDIDDEDD